MKPDLPFAFTLRPLGLRRVTAHGKAGTPTTGQTLGPCRTCLRGLHTFRRPRLQKGSSEEERCREYQGIGTVTDLQTVASWWLPMTMVAGWAHPFFHQEEEEMLAATSAHGPSHPGVLPEDTVRASKVQGEPGSLQTSTRRGRRAITLAAGWSEPGASFKTPPEAGQRGRSTRKGKPTCPSRHRSTAPKGCATALNPGAPTLRLGSSRASTQGSPRGEGPCFTLVTQTQAIAPQAICPGSLHAPEGERHTPKGTPRCEGAYGIAPTPTTGPQHPDASHTALRTHTG